MRMKKIIKYLIIICLFLIVLPAFSQDYNFKPIKQQKQEVKQESSIMPWVLVGADLALAGLGTYFTINGLNAKTEYENQLNLLDNTTMDNYNKLLDMKKDAEGKLNTALGIDIAAGALIAYTLVDAFLLHKIFPEAKMTYNPKNNEIKFMVNKGF